MGAANPAAASSSTLITGSLQHRGNNSERIKYLGWLWFVVFLLFGGLFFVVFFFVGWLLFLPEVLQGFYMLGF